MLPKLLPIGRQISKVEGSAMKDEGKRISNFEMVTNYWSLGPRKAIGSRGRDHE